MHNIYMNLFIVSVDMKTEKRYILSTDDTEIRPVILKLDDNNKRRLKLFLTDYIRSIIPMNVLGILPQIITLHSDILMNSYKKLSIMDDDNGVYSVYGCLVDYLKPVKEGFHWIEFNYYIPNDFSPNIFEVCQNLK